MGCFCFRSLLSCIGVGVLQALVCIWTFLFSAAAAATTTTTTTTTTPVNVRILSQNVQFFHLANTVGHLGYGISAALLNVRPQYDVIVFQEVFVDKGREDLLRWLTPQYPHVLKQQQQPAENKNFSFQFYDSGLLVLSKFPIRQSWYTKYSQSSGLDYLSDKGAVVALLDVPGADNTSAPLLVAGTHMQAGGTRAILKSQVDEMGQLLSRVVSEVMTEEGTNVPPLTVACGDFNIRHTRKALYKYMLKGLSDDTVDTYLEQNQTSVEEEGTTPGSKHRIDYVFHLRKFGDSGEIPNSGTNDSTLVAAGIDRFAPHTSVEGHATLSDHYGAWASFDLNHLVAGPPGPPPIRIPPILTPSPTVPMPTATQMGSSSATTRGLLPRPFWTSAAAMVVVAWIVA